MTVIPTLDVECTLWNQGYRLIAGVDEAGRGALAGPVVAGAVLISQARAGEPIWLLVRDSKTLSPRQRTSLAAEIRARADAWGIGAVDAVDIDEIGIAAATRLAMQQAISALSPAPDHLLIDWVRLPQVAIAQIARPKADSTMASVAAASILAKVHRDELMCGYDATYPLYCFGAHKGYGVAVHLAAIEQYGPCAIHRHSFAPMARRETLFDCP